MARIEFTSARHPVIVYAFRQCSCIPEKLEKSSRKDLSDRWILERFTNLLSENLIHFRSILLFILGRAFCRLGGAWLQKMLRMGR